MAQIKITIIAAADPTENVHTNIQADGLEEAEVRPTLDRAIAALQAERAALDTCPYHAIRPRVIRLIHRALAGDFVDVFTATEQVAKIDKLADDILALTETPTPAIGTSASRLASATAYGEGPNEAQRSDLTPCNPTTPVEGG